MNKKYIAVKITDEQVSEITEFGKKFGFMYYPNTKEGRSKTNEENNNVEQVNLSKVIKFLLICGYVRWNISPTKYIENIIKNKKELRENKSKNMPVDEKMAKKMAKKMAEELNRTIVNIPEKLYDRLENMRVILEKPLKETKLLQVSLFTVTQCNERKNIKKLSMSEFTNIIISIELKKLKNSLKYLKDNKKKTEMMNVSFALPHYIMLCNYLDECGIKQNTIRYLAVFDLFRTS